MKCPVCNEEMKKLPADVSHDPREPGKKYDRTVYQCEKDDVWANIELPRALQNTNQS